MHSEYKQFLSYWANTQKSQMYYYYCYLFFLYLIMFLWQWGSVSVPIIIIELELGQLACSRSKYNIFLVMGILCCVCHVVCTCCFFSRQSGIFLSIDMNISMFSSCSVVSLHFLSTSFYPSTSLRKCILATSSLFCA
jgi:hypothetical protein